MVIKLVIYFFQIILATLEVVRVTVGVVTETNLLVVDDVQGNFIVGAATTHTDGGGTDATLTNPTAVSSDPIRDGHTLLIDHVNHGMHSSSNVVKLENIVGDIEPTSLTTKLMKILQ